MRSSGWWIGLFAMLLASPALGEEVVDRVVAEIGGEPVLLSEWLVARRVLNGSDTGEASLRRYLDLRLLAEEAERYQPDLSMGEVAERSAAILRADPRIPEAVAQRLARNQLLAERLIDVRFRQLVVVLDPEVDAYFHANRARFPGALARERSRVHAALVEARVRREVETLLQRLRRREGVVIR